MILGSIPIGVLGLAFEDVIKGPARNLYLNATVLIVFALVLAAAEHYGRGSAAAPTSSRCATGSSWAARRRWR